MKYKTLFRLAVKFLGLCFIAIALVRASDVTAMLVSLYFRANMQWQPGIFWRVVLSQLGIQSGISLGLGIYLFFRGQWVVNLAIPSNRPYCPHCGYDLKGREHGRHCPECGVGLPADL